MPGGGFCNGYGTATLESVSYSISSQFDLGFPSASGLSRSNRYQTPHQQLRSSKRTLARSIVAFGINSIALLHRQ